MVSKGHHLRTKRKTGRLIRGSCRPPLYRIEKELANIGFIESGADPITIAMENRPDVLYRETGPEEEHCLHSYLLVTFKEKNKKQRKSRW
jgi:hypothetical protein